MSEDQTESPLSKITDELRVQAWLANREFTHPSLHHPDTLETVSALARTRDELRLQLHLGRMEAQEDWHRLEDRWRHLIQEVGPMTETVAESVESGLHSVLKELREGYARLTR